MGAKRFKKICFAGILGGLLFLCTVISIELLSYITYTFTVDARTKDLANLAMFPERALENLRWIPNTLWHHELPPQLVNNYKTIGPDFEMPKPENVYRILCLGDSTSQLPGHHPEFLQKLASNIHYADKTLEVINAGIGSHCSAFTLQYFALRLLHFQPDMVILKVGYNDYLPFSHGNLEFDYTPAFPKPFTIDIRDQEYWRLARFSYLLRVIGIRLLDLPGENFIPNIWGLGDADYMKNKEKMFLYIENIKSIIYLCKMRQIKIWLLDLPVAPPDVAGLGENYRAFIRFMDSELKKMAQKEEVIYIDTKSVLAKEDFTDHCHLTPDGGKKIADMIMEKMIVGHSTFNF